MRVFQLVRRLTLLGGAVFSNPALADRAAAERCATGLQPMGLQIFQRALPGVLGGASVADAVRSAALSMAVSGAVSRDGARRAAEAAGGCLALTGRPG